MGNLLYSKKPESEYPADGNALTGEEIHEVIEHEDTQTPSKLFTPAMRSYLRKAFVMGEFFQVHPYTWNKRKQIPEYIQSKARLCLWYINVLITFAYSGFVMVRCVQTMRDKSKNKTQKVYMQFIAVYFFYPTILQIAAILHGRELPMFIEEYSNFFKSIEKKYFDRMTKKPMMIKICEFLIGNTYRNINCVSCLMVGLCYFSPGSPEHFSSFFEDPESLSFLQKLPFLCFIGYIEIICHSHSLFLIIIELTFILPTLIIIDELSSKNCKLSSDFLRASESKFYVYKSARILLGMFNEIYCTFLLPATKVFLIGIVVMCTYGGVRLHGLIALTLGFIGLFCFCFILILFSLMAEFHGRSTDVLNTWKMENHSLRLGQGWEFKVDRKILKSLMALKVTFRSCYHVDREMVLTMLEGICVETVNFLLANS